MNRESYNSEWKIATGVDLKFPFAWSETSLDVFNGQVCKAGERFIAESFSVTINDAYEKSVPTADIMLSLYHASLIIRACGRSEYNQVLLYNALPRTDYIAIEPVKMQSRLIFDSLVHFNITLYSLALPNTPKECVFTFYGSRHLMI